MSAIYGAVSLAGAPLPARLVQHMDAALAQRPCDASGAYSADGVVLGARALWVTPEACDEPIPHVHAESGLVCVADARLDAREELCARLSAPVDACDEALFVAAYLRWGARFAAELVGDFACALYDPRERRLVLARDALGMRALYYTVTSSALWFASQQRPLFAAGGASRKLDALRVAQYLARDFGDTERTFYADVRRLSPGHTLVLERGAFHVTRDFALSAERELSLPSTRDYTERFRAIFLSAVRDRLRTHLPLGCMLSGGLDSSGVLGAVRSLAPERDVACFSARFRDFPHIDEGEWLSLYDGLPRVTRYEADADRIGPLYEIDRLHDQLEEPFHAPNLFVYVRLAELAQERGARVVLDGLDGDTVVEHGFYFLSELLHRGKLRRLVRELRGLTRRMGMPLGTAVPSWVLGPDRDRLEALVRALAGRHLHHGYLSRELAHASGFDDYARVRALEQLRAPTNYRAMHQRALTAPILPFYFEVHDKAAAALGIDHRHPYFDRRLVELCLALPPEQRLFDGWDRVVQRRALEGLAPEVVRARQSKSVWSENFHRQLFALHGSRMEALIFSEASPLSSVCDVARLRRDFARVRAKGSSEAVLDLWCAVTLGLFLQHAPVTL